MPTFGRACSSSFREGSRACPVGTTPLGWTETLDKSVKMPGEEPAVERHHNLKQFINLKRSYILTNPGGSYTQALQTK
ncbi:hypothetical protein LEMLEM_LOCUS22385 [Lemmus lemmus]